MRHTSSGRSLRRVPGAALVVLTLLVAGCSGSAETASVTMQSGERPSEQPEESELPPSTSAPSTTAPTDPPDEGSSAPDPDALCDSFRSFDPASDADTPESLLDTLEEWRSLAPDELRDQLATLIGMVETLRGLDEQDPASLGDIIDTLLDPALRDAVSGIGEFALEECGVNLDADDFTTLEDFAPGG